jgi:acetoacetyl-CoA synthetase
MSDILWQPSQDDLDDSQMAQFLNYVNTKYDEHLDNYNDLHKWSVVNKTYFWNAVWDFCGIKASRQPSSIFKKGQTMRDAVWFEEAELNFAENLLQRNDDHIAIQYAREDGLRQSMSYGELNEKVYKLAAYLESIGVEAHDRVAGFLPNSPETVIAMLATTLLGAVWTTCSPDFGLDGVLDRFGQIQPKVLFAVESHIYNGKTFQHQELLAEVKSQIDSIKEVILCGPELSLPQHDAAVTPAQLGFDHAAFILYSSGTTGQPKCMVHGAGGTLIQHLKELKLHSDITADDTLFFYTTCGWMMWNWMVSTLALGATIVLYDGAPFATKNKLYDLVDEFNITHFGVGAKYFESSCKFDLSPMSTHMLTSLRCILTTGSPLLPNSFEYIYSRIKNDVRVSSISGGSDIISCFALGSPIVPVYKGELQCIGLGMDVHIFNDEGKAVVGEKGELVCLSAFPSRPIYFWNDASGEKYQHAYFDEYPNVWTHGDFAEITIHHGMIIYGRSDATLNPRGVRIGTAEIYRQVEKIPEVMDAVAVGKEMDGSEIVMLFVVLKPEVQLTKELSKRIKLQIRQNTSPLHVPEEIIQVADLPRTISGKTVELAVKNVLNGRPIKNKSALSNPEVIEDLKALLHQ